MDDIPLDAEKNLLLHPGLSCIINPRDANQPWSYAAIIIMRSSILGVGLPVYSFVENPPGTKEQNNRGPPRKKGRRPSHPHESLSLQTSLVIFQFRPKPSSLNNIRIKYNCSCSRWWGQCRVRPSTIDTRLEQNGLTEKKYTFIVVQRKSRIILKTEIYCVQCTDRCP